MALTLTGVVVRTEPTKSGSYTRLLIAAASRVNDLVMVPGTSVAARSKVGDIVELPVRAAVETNQDGRPTKNITYWLADDGQAVEAA